MAKPLTIVSLNCWGGRFMYNLARFVQKYRDTVDVFCFQEVFDAEQSLLDVRHPGEYLRGTMFKELCELLPDHRAEFARQADPDRMSLAMFVRKDLHAHNFRNEVIFDPKQPVLEGSAIYSSRHIQDATITNDDGFALSIVNFHGMWTGNGKGDTADRYVQSKLVCEFLARASSEYIILGDLNLEPDTLSLRKLTEGRVDLIQKYGITSTRTPLYRKYDDPGASLFADYAIASKGVVVTRFEVLSDLVSDHAPLLVEIS